MKIRASESTNELEITGTSVEWIAFSFAIAEDGLEIPCDHVDDPTPYPTSLDRICIVHLKNEKVEFRVRNKVELVIQGDGQLLEKLAASANNFGNDFDRGSHIHIDYQGEGHYVARNSMSAVLCLE